MPGLQEILTNPEFHALPLSERLKIARGFPDFSALPAKDQGTILYDTAAKLKPPLEQSGASDPGILGTLAQDFTGLLESALSPIESTKSMVKSQLALPIKSAEAFSYGNPMSGFGYGLAATMPLVGPLAARAGEELGGGSPRAGTVHALEALLPFGISRAAEIPAVQGGARAAPGAAGEFLRGLSLAHPFRSVPDAWTMLKTIGREGRDAAARHRETLWKPRTENYAPPIGKGAQPRPGASTSTPPAPSFPEGWDPTAARKHGLSLITRPEPPAGIPSLADIQGITPPSAPTAPDISGLPVPGSRFKPSSGVKRKMSGAPGREIPEIGFSGGARPKITGSIPPIKEIVPKAVDPTTGEELVPVRAKGAKSKRAPIVPEVPPVVPGGSDVPINAPKFKHPAEFTDLIRQFHATHPKGTSMRDLSSKVFGLPPGTMPSYDQALALHEWMLRNPGKTPTPGLK